MRITDVAIYSDYEEIINFPLNNSDRSAKYIVRAITGIDAEEIVPKFYGFGLQNIAPMNQKPRFYDFSMKPRDVVIRVVLNPNFKNDETYADIRDDLYRAISQDRSGVCTLHFYSGATTVARLNGFITKFEVAHFTQLPEAQITVTCNDPMFRAINAVVYPPNVLKTTNPVIVADSLSTAPHGFSLKVTFDGTAASFTIQDLPSSPNWKFKVTPPSGFVSGDQLYLCSDYANRYVYMIHSSSTTYLVDRIEPGSVWPLIFPGSNEFHFVNIASFDWNTLEYYAAYWGV